MSNRWWNEPKNQPDSSIFKQVRYLDSNQVSIQQANLRHMKLYMNENLTGLSYSGLMSASRSALSSPLGSGRLSENVIKSCIDTLVAKIAKGKIEPMFLTDKGSFKMQQQAKSLNQFTSGLLYDIKMPRLAPMVFKDACIFGTGFIKIFSQEDKVVAERVFPDEILVDQVDGYYGDPQCIYQRKFVSKDELTAIFGERFNAVPIIPRPDGGGSQSVEVCLVVEAWKMPSTSSSKDGRHVICCDGVTMLDEVWERPRFPFATLRYTEESLGYFGRGIAEELTGDQIEMNRITQFISDSMKIAGGHKVWLEAGSKVAAQQITNDISTVSHYVGTPPIFQLVQPVAPEYFARLQSLKQGAYEKVGISQLSASSKNALGPNASGEAYRQYHDIESERFMLTGQAYENLHCDVVTLAIDEVERIISRQKKAKEKDPKVKVGYKTKAFSRRDGVVEVDWNDIDLDRDSTVLQCFPASALPKEPGARMSTITEMVQGGLLSKDSALDLLDYPDLDKEVAVLTSPERLVKKICEQMLETGVYQSPEPDYNLALCITTAQNYYNYGKLTNISDDRLECLRSFKADANRLLALSQPPPPQMPPPDGGTGVAGTAMPAPQSPLIPNVA